MSNMAVLLLLLQKRSERHDYIVDVFFFFGKETDEQTWECRLPIFGKNDG